MIRKKAVIKDTSALAVEKRVWFKKERKSSQHVPVCPFVLLHQTKHKRFHPCFHFQTKQQTNIVSRKFRNRHCIIPSSSNRFLASLPRLFIELPQKIVVVFIATFFAELLPISFWSKHQPSCALTRSIWGIRLTVFSNQLSSQVDKLNLFITHIAYGAQVHIPAILGQGEDTPVAVMEVRQHGFDAEMVFPHLLFSCKPPLIVQESFCQQCSVLRYLEVAFNLPAYRAS